MRCPKCRSKKTETYWDKVVLCKKCSFSSIQGEKRYVLVCPSDGGPLFPRVTYSVPTMVCLQCGVEYVLPSESTPHLVDEVLE